MMSVTNKIKIYEVNDEDVPIGKDLDLLVKSHWNDTNRVDLELNGETVTVLARDLLKAIANATNSGQF